MPSRNRSASKMHETIARMEAKQTGMAEEIRSLRAKHGMAAMELKMQKEKTWMLLGFLEELQEDENARLEDEGEDSSTMQSYHLTANPPEYSQATREKSKLTNEQKFTLINKATNTCSGMYTNLLRCTEHRDVQEMVDTQRTDFLDDLSTLRNRMQVLKDRTEEAENRSECHAKKLKKIFMKWHTAALAYNIRPLTTELPILKPPPPPLEWTGRVTGPARINIVGVMEHPVKETRSPHPPRGIKISSKKRTEPIEPDVVSEPTEHQNKIAVQGFRLLISAFCTDMALLLHRLTEVASLPTIDVKKEHLKILDAPPYFVRDRISHALLVQSGFRNPFKDEIPMLHDLYKSVSLTYIPLLFTEKSV